jgi:uncharacterized membrane protein (DUF485 family)
MLTCVYYLKINNNNRYKDGVIKYLEDCIILHEDENVKKLTKHRGKRCYLNKNINVLSKKEKEKREYEHTYCVTTFWSFSHFILYTYIGFFCPSLLFEAFIINILFEAYEKYTIQVNDIYDIFYNTIGLILGYILNKLYFKNEKHTLKSGIIIGIICIVILFILSYKYIIQKQKEYEINKYDNQYKNILYTDDPNDTIYNGVEDNVENKNKEYILKLKSFFK